MISLETHPACLFPTQGNERRHLLPTATLRPCVLYTADILSIHHHHASAPSRAAGQFCLSTTRLLYLVVLLSVLPVSIPVPLLLFFFPAPLLHFPLFSPTLSVSLSQDFAPLSLSLSKGCFDISAVYVLHRHNNLRLTLTTLSCPPGMDPCYYHSEKHA